MLNTDLKHVAALSKPTGDTSAYVNLYTKLPVSEAEAQRP
jgi:hypothetical protein